MDFRSAAAAGLCLPPLGLGNALPVGPPLPSLLTPGLPPPSSLTSLSHAAVGLTSGMYMYTAPPTIATGSQIATSAQQGTDHINKIYRYNSYKWIMLENFSGVRCNGLIFCPEHEI